MELRNLRHAVMLAAERNFARAAERLHITQPALSRSIQALEQELGVRLFNRERSGVTLTVIGATMIARAEDLLRRTRGLEQEVSRMRALEIGKLDFGLAPVPAALFLGPLLRELHTNHPHLHINVELLAGTELLQQLLAERIEFFVCGSTQVPAAEGLTREPLQAAPFAFVVRGGHPLAQQKDGAATLPISALEGYSLATGNLAVASVEKIRQWFELDDEAELPIAIQCNDQAALKSLAVVSDVVLLTARDLVKDEIDAGVLVELPIEKIKLLQASMFVFALDGRSLSPAATLVLDKLRGWASVN